MARENYYLKKARTFFNENSIMGYTLEKRKHDSLVINHELKNSQPCVYCTTL